MDAGKDAEAGPMVGCLQCGWEMPVIGFGAHLPLVYAKPSGAETKP